MRLAVMALLSLGLITAMDSAPTLAASSVDKRLKKLEKKTEYYNKRVRKKSRKYTRNTERNLEGCGDVEFKLDTNIRKYGTSHNWIEVVARYTGNPGTIFVNWGPIGFGFPCGEGETAKNGTVTIKHYCSFDVGPEDTFRISVGTGRGCPKDLLSEIDVNLKQTLIEVIEPE